MSKAEKRRILLFVVILFVAFILMVLIGANIPYEAAIEPEPVTALQKFVEFCINVKAWFIDYAVLLGVIGVSGVLIYRLRK